MLGDRITYQSECCSEPVTYDATAIWNAETQEHELYSVSRDAICDNCGVECGVKTVDIDTGQEIARAHVDGVFKWITADEYEVLMQEREAGVRARLETEARILRETRGLSAYQIEGAHA